MLVSSHFHDCFRPTACFSLSPSDWIFLHLLLLNLPSQSPNTDRHPGHVAFFPFLSGLEDPKSYPKALYLLKSGDGSMYLIVGTVT